MQINLNLSEIKKIIGVDTNLDDSFSVKKISSLEAATGQDIAFLFDRGTESVFSPVNLDLVKNSKAGIIVAQKEIVPGKRYLIVSDPLQVFSKIVNFVQKDKSEKFINENSVVSEKAVLDKTVKVGFSSVVCDNARIEELTVIDTNVFIGKDVHIGKNVKIYSGVKILDGSLIGDNTIIHANAVIGSDGFGYSVTGG